MNPYCYIIVRQDISHEQQIVQAAHVAMEAGFRFSKPESPVYIALLGAPNEP